MMERFQELDNALPRTPREFQRVVELVARSHDASQADYRLGSIRVLAESDDFSGEPVWTAADCECGAKRFRRAHERSDIGEIALRVARFDCPQFGHEQDVAALEQQVAEAFTVEATPEAEA